MQGHHSGKSCNCKSTSRCGNLTTLETQTVNDSRVTEASEKRRGPGLAGGIPPSQQHNSRTNRLGYKSRSWSPGSLILVSRTTAISLSLSLSCVLVFMSMHTATGHLLRCVAFHVNMHCALRKTTSCRRYGITKHCCTRHPHKQASRTEVLARLAVPGCPARKQNPGCTWARTAEDERQRMATALLGHSVSQILTAHQAWLLLLAMLGSCDAKRHRVQQFFRGKS